MILSFPPAPFSLPLLPFLSLLIKSVHVCACVCVWCRQVHICPHINACVYDSQVNPCCSSSGIVHYGFEAVPSLTWYLLKRPDWQPTNLREPFLSSPVRNYKNKLLCVLISVCFAEMVPDYVCLAGLELNYVDQSDSNLQRFIFLYL